MGVESFYKDKGAIYCNPHEAEVRKALIHSMKAWQIDLQQGVIDLAAGSGEVTIALNEHFTNHDTIGIDPYTWEAYQKRTGLSCLRISFEDISKGKFPGTLFGKGLIVCSYAMHLVDESWLPALCYQLLKCAPYLIVVTPHKRPVLKRDWGWLLVEELKYPKTRVRLYAHSTSKGTT